MTHEYLISCDMLNARALVLIAAGPAPDDTAHPFNASLGHLMRALNRNAVFAADRLLPLCESLCVTVQLAGRDTAYCQWYARSLAVLCLGLELPLPESRSAWRQLLAGEEGR